MTDTTFDMPEVRERETIERRILEIAEEESFDARVTRVFGTPDGIEVAEWLLQVFGYWRPVKDLALYEAGRLFMHKIGAANLDLWLSIVKRQHQRALDTRAAEKKKYHDQLKEIW